MAIESHVNITLIPEPNRPDHLVTARYVENYVQGLTKTPVRLVATGPQAGAFTLADKEFEYTAQGPVTIDGEELEQGESVLFAGQADKSENLIFECTHKGVAGTDETILELRGDADEDAKYKTGVSVAVSEGSAHAGSTFRLVTQGAIVIGTTWLDWEPYTPPKGTSVFFDQFTAADGTATADGGMEWQLDHGLNSTNVVVQLFNRDTNSMILAEIETTDADTVTVTFAEEPPAAAGYRAVIIG